jgi:hypothetical protein
MCATWRKSATACSGDQVITDFHLIILDSDREPRYRRV